MKSLSIEIDNMNKKKEKCKNIKENLTVKIKKLARILVRCLKKIKVYRVTHVFDLILIIQNTNLKLKTQEIKITLIILANNKNLLAIQLQKKILK